MNHRAAIGLVVGLALAAGLGVAALVSRAGPVEVSGEGWAPGLTFAIAEARWTPLWGRQAVSVALDPLEGQGTWKFNGLGVKATCEATLAALPFAPEGVQRTDVYRLMLTRIDRTEARLPFEVRDGACVVLPDDQDYVPVFPPPLQDWQLFWVKSVAGKDGAPDRLRFEFRARPDLTAAAGEFDFKAGCEAVLNESALGTKGVPPDVGTAPFEVSALRGVVTGAVRLAGFRAVEFRIEDGACVATGAEDRG
jgi:hypothetical protein